MKNTKVMIGSNVAPQKLHITVTNKGPYLVYGNPPLYQQFIVTNDLGESLDYKQGEGYTTTDEPTALCRCGHSKKQPYCDSSHLHADWDPSLTASAENLLSDAEIYESDELTLVDNEKYCAYARFCHPQGGTWRLTENSDNPMAREEAIRQASLCPGGRLTAWGKDEDEPYETAFEPSLGLLEDPSIGISSGLWVRGGILIEKEDGEPYEVRNRVVMCRCGGSHNKPYCDGSHAQKGWRDNLSEETHAEKVAEMVK